MKKEIKMKVKKIPMRTCVVTREKLPKQELLRIVKFNDEVKVDVTGKMNGKGCYIKKDKSVLEEARKKKLFNRVFEMEVREEIYDEILELI